jgi:bifunctional non-homologous end joining protein LigD
MALDKYVAKRDFSKTKEPKSGKSEDKKALRFVIQKHAASHLHYDFRLEMEGVLKSWAVPKGPSTDPSVKRLAMMVEDHPFDYRTFEGIIPQGQYGGGTVMVWDEGTYESAALEGKDKKAQEKELLKELNEGSIKITLNGKKLKGGYALVKTHGRGENAWLLIKHKDEFASPEDITLQDTSVVSDLTLEKIAETSETIYGQTKRPVKDKATSIKTPTEKKASVPSKKKIAEATYEDTKAIFKKAIKASIPTGIKPMLATLVDAPFDDAGWLYEVKWDGYRCLAFLNKKETQLFSRNNKSFNEKFYPIYNSLKEFEAEMVLDGEIVVLNKEGISDFGALQNWRSEADGDLVYYVFDILWLNGKSLMDLTLQERIAILEESLPKENDQIRQSQVFTSTGTEFFEAAKEMGLEGIMAKKSESAYHASVRTKEWLKIKAQKKQEVIIAGFTLNHDSSKLFSSLLLGVYEKGVLQYAGKVGTGFPNKLQVEMMKTFKPYIVKECPFKNEPDYNKPSRFRPRPLHADATWLKPKLVCEINFLEITGDGVFRHPSFISMREDKPAHEVVREIPAPIVKIIGDHQNNPEKKKMVKAPKDSGKKTLLNPTDETQVRKVNSHEIKFTHLTKLYWPEDGYSKRDMFNYYHQMADYILPHLQNRPMSLNRYPGGIHSQSFYQKDVKGKAPDWVKTFPYSTSDGEKKEYLIATDEASLLWMATLGSIEMNPWFSKAQSPDFPDYCVLDLDPDKNTFDQVVNAALEIKKITDALDIPSYCKTSGSTGMHIYIPLDGKYTYDQSQLFAKLLATIVHQQLPEYTTLERMVAARQGKMYLDFLQNRPGATIAGPYSLRPKPGATVSMPLDWAEVKTGLKMTDFTIKNAVDRVKETGDLFMGVLKKGIDLVETIKKAENFLKAV